MAGVGCSSPEPGSHGTTSTCCARSLPRTVGGNGEIARSQSAHRLVSALVAFAAREPHYVCGAATFGCAVIRTARQHTRPFADNARTAKAEKSTQPLSGVVCRLTGGSLIRVRLGLYLWVGIRTVPDCPET